MSDSVCAVVVTYNRKDLLIECLEALKKQTRPIQGIYLIDNDSTDGTPELLLEKGYISELPPQNLKEPWEKEFIIQNLTNGEEIKLYYVRMHENTGCSGGFYEGVKRGYERGYDWLWLMDDDAEPKEDALEILSIYFKNSNIVGLAGSVLSQNGIIQINHRVKINLKNVFLILPLRLEEYQKQTVEIDMASFVGLLVKRNAIENIGFPKKDFFIHNDDLEYCIRLRSIGKILLVPKSIIFHKEASRADDIERKFLGIKVRRKNFSKLWLSYYSRRNLVWLVRKYSENQVLFYCEMTMLLLKDILGIILYDDNKFKRIKFVVNAYLDGLRGKFDNNKPKKLLYNK
jgi:rhamnopyranosyl-N-acetylglucosaminyl-diphospho-decaprenol beta-1,3/1,4-galactofuranosyltransferase